MNTLSYRLWIIILCCYSALLPAATFRAIVIADTASNLSLPAHQDLLIIRSALEEICKTTGLTLDLEVLEGYSLCYHTIHAALTSPRNQNVDVLMFHYTGHGFRLTSMALPWPSMLLSYAHECLDSQKICEQLTSYHARLTLILFDCCNTVCRQPVILKGPEPSLRPRDMKKIFLQNSGRIIATASQPGAPSYAFIDGSLFTTKFFRNLLHRCHNNQDTWIDIFSSVAMQCVPYQSPLVQLDIREFIPKARLDSTRTISGQRHPTKVEPRSRKARLASCKGSKPRSQRQSE